MNRKLQFVCQREIERDVSTISFQQDTKTFQISKCLLTKDMITDFINTSFDHQISLQVGEH